MLLSASKKFVAVTSQTRMRWERPLRARLLLHVHRSDVDRSLSTASLVHLGGKLYALPFTQSVEIGPVDAGGMKKQLCPGVGGDKAESTIGYDALYGPLHG